VEYDMTIAISRRSFLHSLSRLGGATIVGAKLGANSSFGDAAIAAGAFAGEGSAAPQSAGDVSDWPEWRGRGRLGVWSESGILDRFPERGLDIRWRTPIRSGYAGPAVSGGRVFISDFSQTRVLHGTERLLALDEATGRIVWAREWETSYVGMLDTWATGPGATATVDGDRVYVLGRGGALLCLRTDTGEPLWRKDYMKDYGAEMPMWGFAGAPLVDGNRLICLVGGANAKVMAFDKISGTEMWRALPSTSEPGYAQPVIIDAGGTRQLIVWHPVAVSSLDPATGRVYWEEPFKITYGMTVPTVVRSGSRLLVSCFYNGSLMFSLDGNRPAARVLWKGKSDSEVQTDGLHSVICTPVIQGDYVYGLCSYGELRCLNANTGARVWDTQAVTVEKARWAQGHIVRQGDRYFINNDRGDLIIARLAPTGYQEISRTALIKPTSNPGNRRALGAVNWSHPAYANRRIYARNDEEILCASLAAPRSGAGA
jgi:outer membrane protein assembly factor BamB